MWLSLKTNYVNFGIQKTIITHLGEYNMFDNTVLKEANEAVFNYATTATKKTVELQTSLFKEFVALNKTLYEMSPAKDWLTSFGNFTSPKK